MNTTLSLNAELFQQLGLVADDKTSLKKIIKYVKGIVASREEEKAAAAREKAETLENIRQAFLEFKDLQAGKGEWTSWEDFKKELAEDECRN